MHDPPVWNTGGVLRDFCIVCCRIRFWGRRCIQFHFPQNLSLRGLNHLDSLPRLPVEGVRKYGVDLDIVNRCAINIIVNLL